MTTLRKNIFFLAFFSLVAHCLAEDAPILSDWMRERRTDDWKIAMAAVSECGFAPAPELPPELQKESAGYLAYLQAKYLISAATSPKEADAEVIVPLLVQAIDAFPEEEAPVIELAMFRDNRGEKKEFIEDLRSLLEHHPDTLRLLRLLAMSLMDERQMESADTVLRHLLEVAPDDSANLLLWGEFLFLQHRSQELGDLIQRFDAMPDGECSPDHLQLAIRHFRREDQLAEALREAERLVHHPKVYQISQTAYQVPPVLTSLHAWELLRQFVTQFEKQNANNIPADLRRRLCRACTNANLALRDYDALGKYLEELIATAGNDLDLFNIFAAPIELLIDDGEQPDKDPQRLLELSARAYETMMLRAPRNMKYRRHLCILYTVMGAHQKALALLETLQSPTPEDQLLMADLLISLKRHEEALAIYEQFEHGQQNRQYRGPGYYLQYGYLAEQLGETERALAILRKGLKAYPNSPQLANSLGFIMADHHQNLDEAKRLIELALKKTPNSPAYLDSLAWVYYRQGDVQQALIYMAKAVQRSALSIDELDQELRGHLQDILKDAGYPAFAEVFAPLTLEN